MPKPFLDLRRLRYFLAIADHGAISAAARSLNVAQPALSHHVAGLERDLGGDVFRRLQSGVELTPLGAALAAHARRILAEIAEAEADLLDRARGTPTSGTVRLAVIPSLASALTPALVAGFAADLPEITLHLIDARTALGRELVDSGRADVAIHLVSPSEVADEPIAWEDLHYVFLRERETGAGPIPFQAVAAARLVLPSAGNPLRRFLQQAADAAGLPLPVALEVDGPDPRRQAVLAGLGSTVFGAHTVASDALGPRLAARRIVDPVLTRPIVMEARKGFDAGLRLAVHRVLKAVIAAMPKVP